MGNAGGLRSDPLVHDWSSVGDGTTLATPEVLDETLRDGLQSPAVTDPSAADKVALLHAMAGLGIDGATVGFPAASTRAFEHAVRLATEVATARLELDVVCAARTLEEDVAAALEVGQRSGLPVAIYAFVGVSPIRHRAEGWDLASVARRIERAVALAVRAGHPVAFVAEDATRTPPETLRILTQAALARGASRVCVCDTVGHAAPEGVRRLLSYVRHVIDAHGRDGVGIDWHGHDDRGLALANALVAVDHGADRVHATALGMGERTGNTAMEQLLLNLALEGRLGNRDLSTLADYAATAARATEWSVPPHQPVVGRDAFRTASGVHAAAILKARGHADRSLVERVYCGTAASRVGCVQEVCISHNSGAANVRHWLRDRGIKAPESLVRAILRRAKGARRVLTDVEIYAVVDRPPRSASPLDDDASLAPASRFAG
ncbi:MAG: LeuA family protein [Myxococcota bacterium]